MKLSTKGRYASRAALELAMAYGKGPILLREIARKQEISVRYLERMMTALVASGLIRSTRGKHGGFVLSKPPSEIRLSEVIQAVEGPITPVNCVDDPKLCDRYNLCITKDIWERLKKAMLEVLDSITLEDMVEMHQRKSESIKEQMYYI